MLSKIYILVSFHAVISKLAADCLIELYLIKKNLSSADKQEVKQAGW